MTTGKLVLWGAGTMRTHRTLWLAEELGLDYEHRPIGPRTGETRTDEFLAINPRHKVPAMVHGDICLTESAAIMNHEIAKWPTAEILARLDREVVPAAPVLRRGEVLADAQVVENGIIEVREDPELGPVRQPRPAARFNETPAAIRSFAPCLGADNATILEELGYDEADIARLAEDRVLHRWGPKTAQSVIPSD